MQNQDCFRTLAEHYDIFLIDMVGVIYDGITYFPGALESINHLIQNNKKVIFLSNNPRPAQISLPKLKNAGFVEPFDLLTSGDLTRHLLTHDHAGKLFFHLGAARNSDITHEIPFSSTPDLEEAEAILLTLFLEEHEDISLYEKEIAAIAKSQKLVLCANPDKHALHGENLRTCAGTFAELIRNQGGNVEIIGKPEANIYSFAEKTFNFNKSDNKTLMIGDTLETDILGAHNFGIDSLLVLSGITGMRLKQNKMLIKDYCLSHGLPSPTYVSSDLHL